MKRRYSDTDLAPFAIAALATTTTDKMGRSFRTPSPVPEDYISSSNVNSPTIPPAFLPNSTEGLRSYQERREIRALELEDAERGQNKLRQLASLSSLKDIFGPQRDHVSKEDALMRKEHRTTAEAALKEPKTPTKKQVQNLWHGLPSPETPTFHGNTLETQSAVSSAVTTDLTPASPINKDRYGPRSPYKKREQGPQTRQDDTERDAMLAQELEAELSPTTTRRSTRLRAVPKPVYAPHIPAAASRPVRNTPAGSQEKKSPTQPELSIVACKADPIPFEGLPTIHSLSWQLQYPPGGSTHPSYPYPLMDPRLIFHQSFVPVVDGLPDFTKVPKLVLPMGWKHVSWTGLLPIAFDPYQQAFKLTPIGPMPLTCEEVRQGGLHKYVPGGELHPEYGMLPDMLKLSDGSDAEVFDFDGIDWTLPWEGHVHFHAPTTSANDFQITVNGYATSSITSTTAVTIAVYPWKEARDCPNQIFDLSDAWRWLAGKEVSPTTDFVPTPKKKWYGTGAVRSNRKLKSPIPELMMGAQMSSQDRPEEDAYNANPLLQNQDTSAKGNKNIFCPFKSVATPMYVDITLLGDTEFTIMELLCYFPQHFNWGHAADRLAKAGLTPANIRDFINMTRTLQGDTALLNNNIGGAAQAAKKRDLPKPEEIDIDEVGGDTPTPASKSEITDMTMTYTAEGWVYDVWEKMDYPLLGLAHGLQALPSGPDAGPLTALILLCRKEGRYQVFLSEVPALLKEAGIEPLIEPGEAGCPDKEVVARDAEAMKKDRLRVVRSAGEKKRALDSKGDKEENKSKRRKASEWEDRYHKRE